MPASTTARISCQPKESGPSGAPAVAKTTKVDAR